ncbi:MAG: hypothetical protein E7263_09080 [Lachnospiraceae bacterium]|nr:hypothetical protein [Lachnospiraceae bacterium]
MKSLLYYFIFENEYMNIIIDSLCDIFCVSKDKNSVIYRDGSEQVYILDGAGEGVACVLANNASYIYTIYIFSKIEYQEKIEHMLSSLCDEIEEEYGEDRSRYINNITMDADVMVDCIKTAEKFGYENILQQYIVAK